ncbi:MAG: SDR family NAD(P)-dependent oxidoreductase [Planctomycetota bacterium]
MDTQTLKGRTVLITGASSGIGEATALALAEAGADLALGARREGELERVASLAREKGAGVVIAKTDVTDIEQVRALVGRATDEFGGIDAVFNNAGVEGSLAPIDQDTDENFDHVMGINVKGMWNVLRATIPALKARGGGSIINNSSVAGRRGFGSFSTYVASKHAVEGYTKSAAAELAEHNIRVNTVAPGPIETRMLDDITGGDHSMFTSQVPMQRAGSAEEVARVVVFLASDASSYVSGQTLGVDGAMTA